MTEDSERAQERYSPYYALWPLQAMGIVDEAATGSSVWSDIQEKIKAARDFEPTRVAIIDTSVAVNHPNLEPAIDKRLAIDFVSNRLGAFPYTVAGATSAKSSSWIPHLSVSENSAADVVEGIPRAKEILGELLERLTCGDESALAPPASGWAFSAHGTAIAGLVGARPVQRDHAPLANARVLPIDLAFAGVDPFCRIVPVSTGFDPDPEQLILAFLYAELIDADVVVVPRDIPDPRFGTGGTADADLETDSLPPDERALWESLRQLICAISRKRPIVCAAGNGGDRVIYPARLALPENGVIAVGAVNGKGHLAGYSSFGQELTVLAPSSDGERFDREEIRLDTQDADFDKNLKFRTPRPVDYFSHLDVISTDVPGRFGYNGSRFREPFLKEQGEVEKIRDYGSLFCRFGGTSAATALVGGFISLGITSGVVPRGASGADVKRWLLSKSKPSRTGTTDVPVPVWQDDAAHPRLPPPTAELLVREM